MTRTVKYAMTLTFALSVVSCEPSTTAPPPVEVEVDGLARPIVAERDASRPRYIRDEWDGAGWADEDGDGCNTRAEVLMAESSVPTQRKANCTVLAGAWVDPWTGAAHVTATAVQVDHLVALADASASGGWAWSAERKVAFANDLSDPMHLNAVGGAVNGAKADHGPDRWLPALASARCAYVESYVAIKARWGLTITPAAWAAVLRAWEACQ